MLLFVRGTKVVKLVVQAEIKLGNFKNDKAMLFNGL